MRVAPVGLACVGRPAAALPLAIESSRPTHSHPLAYAGAAIQATAVATAAGMDTGSDALAPGALLGPLRACLRYFDELMQDTSKFAGALDAMERGLGAGASCAEMSEELGTGIEATEAVPMALYCFLRHSESFADAIHHSVFIGGDTDTIASMTGALAGALLGEAAIPAGWVAGIREETYSPTVIGDLADRLCDQYGRL
jgi:poly(ADP-ribose) glycohydrolase ARH3